MLDAQGVEKLMNGDLEGDAAVLLEPHLVSAATRAVRDDCVAAAVSRDDVQVVRLPVALNKPVNMNEAETVLRRPDAAVLVDVFDPAGDGGSLR